MNNTFFIKNMNDTILKNNSYLESNHLNKITINMLLTSHLGKNTIITLKEFHRCYFHDG